MYVRVTFDTSPPLKSGSTIAGDWASLDEIERIVI